MTESVVLEIAPIADALRSHWLDQNGRCTCGAWVPDMFSEHLAAAVVAAVPIRTEAEVKAEALTEAADWIEAGARSFAAKMAFRKARSKSEDQRNARTGHRAAGQISVARTLRSRAYQLRKGDAS